VLLFSLRRTGARVELAQHSSVYGEVLLGFAKSMWWIRTSEKTRGRSLNYMIESSGIIRALS
jgi:hypothetical protein